jgi:hypothetical protein
MPLYFQQKSRLLKLTVEGEKTKSSLRIPGLLSVLLHCIMHTLLFIEIKRRAFLFIP